WGIAATLGTIVIGWDRLRDEMRRMMEYHSSESAKPWWPFVVYHLLAFTVLGLMTSVVCSEDIQLDSHAGLWVVFWIASALATLALWAAAVFPAVFWAQTFRRTSGVFILGAVLGLGACLAGRMSQEWWNYWPRQPAMWAASGLLGVFCEQAYHPS